MEGNKDLDIKHFQQYPSGAENDRVLMVKGTTETPASLTLTSLRNFLVQFITPSIRNDNWYIGETDTKVQAEGKTPMLRLAQNGIEYRYSEKENWAMLVPLDKIKLHFTDLDQSQKEEIRGENVYLQATSTEIQWKIGEKGQWQSLISLDVLKLKFKDLTPADIALLQKPALDISKELKEHPDKVSDTYTWLVWDAVSKKYIDTRVSARGRSPKIVDKIWWVWDDETQNFVSTGQAVDSDFQLTKQKIENVLTGDIKSHNHDTQIEEKLKIYAKKEDLNSKQDTLTKEAVENVLKGEISTHSHDSQIAEKLKPYATKEELNSKQDTLKAGVGIEITDNVVSCVLDSDVFTIVTSLPKEPEKKNAKKIFVVPSTDGEEGNIYDEYLWIEDSKAWELVGNFKSYELIEQIKDIEGRVKDNESRISKNEQDISLKASKNDIEDSINGIKIGVRNLLPNSKEISSELKQAEEGASCFGKGIWLNGKPWKMTDKWKMSIGISGNSNNNVSFKPTENLKPDTEYIFSVGYSKVVSGRPATAYTFSVYDFTSNNGIFNTNLKVGGIKQTVNITTPKNIQSSHDIRVVLYSGLAGDSDGRAMTWGFLKLEEGNKPTQWTDAPEDVPESLLATGIDIDSHIITLKDISLVKDTSEGKTPVNGSVIRSGVHILPKLKEGENRVIYYFQPILFRSSSSSTLRGEDSSVMIAFNGDITTESNEYTMADGNGAYVLYGVGEKFIGEATTHWCIYPLSSSKAPL